MIASCAAAGMLAACTTPSQGPPEPGPSIGQQLNAALPAPVSNSVLVTSDGRRLSLASLAGKVLVISDVMTLCQQTCPLDTANVVAAAKAADAAGLLDKVDFLSITIDPSRDTLAQLSAYRDLYRPAPANWLDVTATPQDLTALWSALGVYIQKVPDTPPAPTNWRTGKPLTYDLTHSDELFFFDTTGHERFVLDGAPHVAAGALIPAALRRFMDANGQNNLAHPDPLAWTLPQALQIISWLAGREIPNHS